jgi:hypothetical protein
MEWVVWVELLRVFLRARLYRRDAQQKLQHDRNADARHNSVHQIGWRECQSVILQWICFTAVTKLHIVLLGQ